MVREICKDPVFLAQRSEDAGPEDLPVALDLLDTLSAHAQECVGMAANMIGISKRIIVFDNEGVPAVMLNPEIIKCSQPYMTEEGCLSLAGVRPCERYRKITVKYQDDSFKWQTKDFQDFTAQIIQHECDHLRGVII